jgi:hypothetical protein
VSNGFTAQNAAVDSQSHKEVSDEMKVVTRSLATRTSPEEEELQRKKAELAALQDTVAQRELDLLTLQREQQVLEAAYLRSVGRAFADLDALVAQIAQLLAQRHPSDRVTTERAEQARQQSARNTDAVANADPCTSDADASAQLRSIYREVAKRIHPDLADSEEDQAVREELMKAANAAYEHGDIDALREILENWQARPEAVKGEGVGQELIRVIRKIAQLSSRLAAIESAIGRITSNGLYSLRTRTAALGRIPTDVFEEMEAEVRGRITHIEETLTGIVDAHRKEQTCD